MRVILLNLLGELGDQMKTDCQDSSIMFLSFCVKGTVLMLKKKKALFNYCAIQLSKECLKFYLDDFHEYTIVLEALEL